MYIGKKLFKQAQLKELFKNIVPLTSGLLLITFLCGPGGCSQKPVSLPKGREPLNKGVSSQTPSKKHSWPRKTLSKNNNSINFQDNFSETQTLIEAQNCSDKGNHKASAEILSNLIKKTKDKEMLQDLCFKRAKQLFLANDWTAACRTLEHFATAYKEDPRSADAEFMLLFAQYQVAKRISIECDAGETQKVLNFANRLAESDRVGNRQNDVLAIKNDCQERIFSKAVSTFEFYLRRSDIKSARGRLDRIKQEFLGPDFKKTTVEPRVMYLECKLAKAMDNTSEAQSIANMLTDKFPESKFAKMAETHLNASKILSF